MAYPVATAAGSLFAEERLFLVYMIHFPLGTERKKNMSLLCYNIVIGEKVIFGEPTVFQTHTSQCIIYLFIYVFN